MIYLPGDAGTSKQGGKDLDPTKAFWWKLGPKAFASRNRSIADSLETSNSDSKAGSLRYLIPRGYADDVSSTFSEQAPSYASSTLKGILKKDVSTISFQNAHKPCLEGTCTLVLDEIRNWANDSDSPPVFALVDQAGTGKSTIATTLAHEWKKSDRLRACFYFMETSNIQAYDMFSSFARGITDGLRGPEENPWSISEELERIVFGTLRAEHVRLMNELNTVRRSLGQIRTRHGLGRNLFEGSSNGDTVTEHSLSKPYQSMSYAKSVAIHHLEELEKLESKLVTAIRRPPILIIDALDECPTPDAASILRGILESVSDDSPCKFFITFRPENDLVFQLIKRSKVVQRLTNCLTSRRYAHNRDIEIYARAHLPPVLIHDRLYAFVEQANGFFFWASYAQKFIASSPKGPHFGLEHLKDATPADLAPLFALYDSVLVKASKRCSDQELKMVLQILASFQQLPTLRALEDLVCLSDGSQQICSSILDHLRSVISFDGLDNPGVPLHPTFTVYLRSGLLPDPLNFSIEDTHDLLACGCYKSLHANLVPWCLNNSEGYEYSLKTNNHLADIDTKRRLHYAALRYLYHLKLTSTYPRRPTNASLSQLSMLLIHHSSYWLEYVSSTKQLAFFRQEVIALRDHCLSEAWESKWDSKWQISEWCDEIDKFIKSIQDAAAPNAGDIQADSLIPHTGLIHQYHGDRLRKSMELILREARLEALDRAQSQSIAAVSESEDVV